MTKMMDRVKRKLGMFDSHGLKFSVDHLCSIQNEIPFYTLQDQSRYADVVTTRDPDNEISLIYFEENEIFDQFNSTSVGNLAYMALHAKDPELRKKCIGILDRYKAWVQKKLKK